MERWIAKWFRDIKSEELTYLVKNRKACCNLVQKTETQRVVVLAAEEEQMSV
jgi:hypothetical protein